MWVNIRFRDYGQVGITLAVIINMVLVGMWHGANLTFAVFGLYHGLLFIPLVLSGTFMKRAKKEEVGWLGLPLVPNLLRMIGTYLLVAFGLVIFRAESMADCINYLNLCVSNFDIVPDGIYGKLGLYMALPMLVYEWYGRQREYPLIAPRVGIFRYQIMRTLFYAIFFVIIMMYASSSSVQFIYFQF